MEQKLDGLMTTHEVAQRLHVAVSTVYKWARSGMLPCVPMGRSLRFRPESIEKFVDAQEKIAYGKVA